MNKIKDKINPLLQGEQFSPWEESFINLVKTLKSNRQSSPKKDHYLTLDPYKKHKCQKYASPTKYMGRTSFNMSKINLRSNQEADLNNKHQLIRNQSRKYEGPRLTFYSKMNPKCSDKSNLAFKSLDTMAEHSYLSDNLPNNRLVRDTSIRYLDILDDRPFVQQIKDPPPPYLLSQIYPSMSKKSSLILSHHYKLDQNMKRFKILYSTRKSHLKK